MTHKEVRHRLRDKYNGLIIGNLEGHHLPNCYTMWQVSTPEFLTVILLVEYGAKKSKDEGFGLMLFASEENKLAPTWAALDERLGISNGGP